MSRNTRFILFVIIHLFIEFLLTLISSIDCIFLVISLLIYLSLISKEQYDSDILSSHYYSSVIFILFHYLGFTLSYAEILLWETGIILLLVILIINYIRKLTLLTNKSYFTCLPFGKTKEEFDSNVKILMIKYLLANICLCLYSFHLCLTTICTPEMYFNWFLMIKNCRYTYSTFHSSYTLSGGIIVSFSWIFISSYYFVLHRFR